PSDFVEATKFFQAHGMGDPRGGKFVQAFSASALSWQGILVEPLLWRGWIAKQADGKTRFTGIDGLSYDLYSSLKADDLDGFVNSPAYMRSVDTLVRRFEEDQSVFLVNNHSPHPSLPRREPGAPNLPSWNSPAIRSNQDLAVSLSPEVFAALCFI